jgi:hypothetical protein
MANNAIIYTAADYKIKLTYSTFDIKSEGTGKDAGAIIESLDVNIKVESENVYGIGSKYPQGLKTNGYSYSGKLSLEAGEAEKFCVKAGIGNMTEVYDATLVIIALSDMYSKTYSGVVITSNDLSVKAKDKRTIVSFSWDALAETSSSKQG